ncbi:MAG: GNAT family N-acetyltransferase [Dehalococcoidia bacterium]|nr:GNAT family N-acetyltransferase [Dehalococcoidia bacterium]
MTARAKTGQGSLRRTAVVRRVADERVIRQHLEAAGAYSAYGLAYMDPRLFPLAGFYEATCDKRQALVMHARGGLGPTTLTLGDTDLVRALLQLHPGPRQTFLTCEIGHVDVLLRSHDLWRPQTMMRMQLDREAFAPPAGLSAVRRLIDADADELNRLYAIEEDGLRYSGRQVGEGIYFGVHARGRLVAAAGTHIHSTAEGVAVIGNVFTHPDFRARGYGTAVTAAVSAYLLRTCSLVVLNVDPANRTARHIYEQMGFKETGRLVEAMATRRDPFSPLAPLRRAVARWRSSLPDTEVIEL